MKLLLGHDREVSAWVAQRIPLMHGPADFSACTAIGVLSEDGRPLGGIVYANYQPRFGTMELSFAAEGGPWLSRKVLTGIMAYPFDQCGCQRVTTLTPRKNRPARVFLEVFGFKREGVIRHGFGRGPEGDDIIVSGLLKEEWARNRFNLNRTSEAQTAPQCAMRRRTLATG